LDVKINDISASERELEVSFKYDEIKSDIETEVQKQTKKIQLPGFRKGKAPISVLKKMYGDALEYEASEKIANNRFWEISKEKALKPIGQPFLKDIKFNPGTDLYFKVLYETYPVLEVKDYKDQEIEIPDFQVKDEDVNKEIEYISRANSTKEKADIVGDDPNYLLDLEIKRIDDKGELYKDSKPEKIQVDLSNEKVQPEIIENAKGKKKGESFNFSFKDERTIKNSEGKEEKIEEAYNYKAEINEIEKIVLPDLTEELIKKVTKDKVSTEEELRADIKKDIQGFYDQRMEEVLNNKLVSMIIKNNDFEPPKTLVYNILSELVKHEEEHAKKEKYKDFNKEETSKRLLPNAENEVKWFLLKSEIQKKENINITDDDLKELAEKDAEKTGIDIEKLMNYYKSSNYNEKLIDKKLFDFLKENNKIKNVDPEKYSKTESKESK
jgi:trigger factor